MAHEHTVTENRPNTGTNCRERERGVGGRVVLLSLPAFLPSVIFLFFPKIRAWAPPLDPPLFEKVVSVTHYKV